MGLNVAKRWLALPPEIDSPLDAIGGFNPYVPVAKQFRALLKGMQSDTSFSANTNANMKAGILFDNITDSTVLHCLQRPGDIVYIPDGWPHMTLNEGGVFVEKNTFNP